MNKLAIISAFLGGVKNRYMTYEKDRSLEEKFSLASKIKGLDGLELCYPADFENLGLLKSLLSDHGFGVSSVNVRSRRTGKWWRGAFTSAKESERKEVVEDFKRAIDAAREIGVNRISTCPLNDGHDYVFEMNYIDSYGYAQETFAAICEYDRNVKLCIEYKCNDPRVRCFFASAGETAAFCNSVGAENLGATLDIGHSLQGGERPAQAAALLAHSKRLFYVHLNDNDRNFDWDLMPGAFHFWEFIEFFYYLKELEYTDDWYAYDVMSKEIDTVETFNTVVEVTRKLEHLSEMIDRKQMEQHMKQRNPARLLSYLYKELV
ncbi:MAG: sugar phosphate isomerase/epimerase [Deltaproteobacteria bacterium]|nr:sugar phosphate isomerase/epimerase [Deltaproteobacteria bacterium]MBW1960938.1 sugar phosphate isomerase/epimerase [Deltaproteobacteria bacterium]MBW1993831.1 sugar phosphate isomerase/epimerase [Deltaproteobacteria bacterium]MBW2152630.1 sugar phosphate isomerase/epimerase [Deltaproteobacteria bacterium]